MVWPLNICSDVTWARHGTFWFRRERPSCDFFLLDEDCYNVDTKVVAAKYGKIFMSTTDFVPTRYIAQSNEKLRRR